MVDLPAQLDHYQLLGRSGLRVSPLCLGTMTFGTVWGWGSDKEDSRAVLEKYADAGGNFIDTSNYYTDGESERFLGEFLQDGVTSSCCRRSTRSAPAGVSRTRAATIARTWCRR